MSAIRQQKYITLAEWASRTYGENQPHVNTLRRWARDGTIIPKPFKMGREFYVVPSARHVNEPAPDKGLVSRLGLASA